MSDVPNELLKKQVTPYMDMSTLGLFELRLRLVYKANTIRAERG